MERENETSLTLIIPVYNYADFLERNILRIIKELETEIINFEIIFVDDGSKDKTKEVLGKVIQRATRIKLISYRKNRGKGYAVKKGILNAQGEIIFFTDADLPFGIQPILEGYRLIKKGNCDLVLGQRAVDSWHGWKRKIASQFFSFFVKLILDLDISDTQCGLKGFKKEVAKSIFEKVKIKGFSFDVELLYLAKKQQFAIETVPVKLIRPSVMSTVSLFTHPIRMFFDIFLIKVNDFFGRYN